MRLNDRFAEIEVALEDLQAGMEACTRGADAVHSGATKLSTILKLIKRAPLVGPLLKRTRDLLGCARDQRGTLGQLREHVDRLKDELKRQHSVGASARPVNAADRRRDPPPLKRYTAARSFRVRSR